MHLGDNLFKPKKLAVKETRKLSKKKHVAKNLIVWNVCYVFNQFASALIKQGYEF